MKRRDVYKGYLHPDFNPDPDKFVLCHFYFEPAGSFENSVQAIAAESSVGTWTELSTMKKRISEKLSAKVYKFNRKKREAFIAYPLDLFEPENVPQLLSDIADAGGGSHYAIIESADLGETFRREITNLLIPVDQEL